MLLADSVFGLSPELIVVSGILCSGGGGAGKKAPEGSQFLWHETATNPKSHPSRMKEVVSERHGVQASRTRETIQTHSSGPPDYVVNLKFPRRSATRTQIPLPSLNGLAHRSSEVCKSVPPFD